tara:strand:- start:2481 stop:3182 length:702 start_codon:yes stop_codon:yes gene_type:complete
MKKIVVLTTKTLHHNFFCQQLLKKFFFQIIYETRKVVPKYKIFHSYIKKRNKFEKKKFFGSKKIDYLFDYKVKNLNDKKSINLIKKLKPTHILCFGISKLEKNFIKSFSKIEISNLHGGDPEKYRGLDSLLWSIYFNDFSSLYTTLHILKHRLDTGPIIAKKKIKISKKINLENLRYFNTINCIKLTEKYFYNILKSIKTYKKKQKKIGSYYSYLPSDKINLCKKNLEYYKLN